VFYCSEGEETVWDCIFSGKILPQYSRFHLSPTLLSDFIFIIVVGDCGTSRASYPTWSLFLRDFSLLQSGVSQPLQARRRPNGSPFYGFDFLPQRKPHSLRDCDYSSLIGRPSSGTRQAKKCFKLLARLHFSDLHLVQIQPVSSFTKVSTVEASKSDNFSYLDYFWNTY